MMVLSTVICSETNSFPQIIIISSTKPSRLTFQTSSLGGEGREERFLEEVEGGDMGETDATEQSDEDVRRF